MTIEKGSDDTSEENQERMTIATDRMDVASDRTQGILRWILWICCALAVLLIGSVLRSYVVQDQIDDLEVILARTEAVSIESRDSAKESLKELREAIARVDEARAGDRNEAVAEALAAIARIENYVCGGPCPEVE